MYFNYLNTNKKILLNNYNFQKFGANLCRIQGNRNSMEDYYYIDIIDNNIKILGLFDGHGGNDISYSIPKHLKNINKYFIAYKLNKLKKSLFVHHINKEFLKIDKKLYNDKNYKQGSTAILLYIFPLEIIVINLGDSKTIFFDQFFQNKFETVTHRPNLYNEYKRIINSNNHVVNINGTYRINGQLSLSRSFGDYQFKMFKNKYNGINSPISIIPDIYFFPIKHKYIIIIGTDGFWDYITINDIKNIIMKYNIDEINLISEKLILNCIKNGSNDNISLIIYIS